MSPLRAQLGQAFASSTPAKFALFLFLGLAIYSPALNGPFVFDGETIRDASLIRIQSLPEIERVLLSKSTPRRVGLGSFALNFWAHGLVPFGYHLTNVVIHALNGLLVLVLVGLLLRSPTIDISGPSADRIAFTTALLWLVNPVQTQAVAYIYQRYTSLSALFYLSFLGCFFGAWLATHSRPLIRFAFVIGAAVCLGAGLETKETVAMAPLFAILIGWMIREPSRERVSWRSLALPAGAAILFSVIASRMLGPNFMSMIQNDYLRRGFSLSERLLTESRVVLHYLGLLIAPHPSRLTLDYDYPISTSVLTPPTTLISILVILVLIGWALLNAKRSPIPSLAIFWYFGNLAIESTFVPLDLVYEHRAYLPSIGIMLLGAYAMEKLRRNTFRRLLVFGLCVTWSFWSHQRSEVWADPVLLWEANASQSPDKARVHANLGKAYTVEGRVDEALEAFETALRLDPSLTGARISLANLYLSELRDLDGAKQQLDLALEREPAHPAARLSLGVWHLRRGDAPRAVTEFERILENDPSNQAALYNLAAAHYNLGAFEESRFVAERAVYYWPDYPAIWALLGACHCERYRSEGASSSRDAAQEAFVQAASLGGGNDPFLTQYPECR